MDHEFPLDDPDDLLSTSNGIVQGDLQPLVDELAAARTAIPLLSLSGTLPGGALSSDWTIVLSDPGFYVLDVAPVPNSESTDWDLGIYDILIDGVAGSSLIIRFDGFNMLTSDSFIGIGDGGIGLHNVLFYTDRGDDLPDPDTGTHYAFNGNTVFNGVAFWDLSATYSTTKIGGNSQGCVQLIGDSIVLNNVRYNNCAFNPTSVPEPSTLLLPAPASARWRIDDGGGRRPRTRSPSPRHDEPRSDEGRRPLCASRTQPRLHHHLDRRRCAPQLRDRHVGQAARQLLLDSGAVGTRTLACAHDGTRRPAAHQAAGRAACRTESTTSVNDDPGALAPVSRWQAPRRPDVPRRSAGRAAAGVRRSRRTADVTDLPSRYPGATSRGRPFVCLPLGHDRPGLLWSDRAHGLVSRVGAERPRRMVRSWLVPPRSPVIRLRSCWPCPSVAPRDRCASGRSGRAARCRHVNAI